MRNIYFLVTGNGYYPLWAAVWLVAVLAAAVLLVTFNREDIKPTNRDAATTAVQRHFGIETQTNGTELDARQQQELAAKQQQADAFLPVTAETPCEVHPGYPCMNSLTFAINAVLPPAASTNRDWDIASDATLALSAGLPLLKLLSWALAALLLAGPYAARVASLLHLIDVFDAEEAVFVALIAERLGEHRGYRAIQGLPGVGPTLGAIFVAEIGDVHRFAGPAALCSWAGLTPRHYESDTVVRRGHISKQGSKLVRWATVEAIQRKTTVKIGVDRQRIEARRGKNIAKIAAARKLLTLVYYGLRDEKSGRWPGTRREPPGRGIRVVVVYV